MVYPLKYKKDHSKDPWKRLNNEKTVARYVGSVYFRDRPTWAWDRLDFLLNSVHQQGHSLFPTPAQVAMQPQSIYHCHRMYPDIKSQVNAIQVPLYPQNSIYQPYQSKFYNHPPAQNGVAKYAQYNRRCCSIKVPCVTKLGYIYLDVNYPLVKV